MSKETVRASGDCQLVEVHADAHALWDRFTEAMKAIVAVPKQNVDEAMQDAKQDRAEKRGVK